MGPPGSRVRHAPTASKFSSAKPTGSITLWQLAQTGWRGAPPAARAACCGLARRRCALSDGTSGGGGGTGRPSRFSSTHLPRRTGDVRSACDVTARMLPWPSRPRRASSVDGHAAEPAAVDVGNAVVPRQPFVDEGVVGAQQIQDAAVLAQDALEQQLGLAPERLAQVVVEVRELVGVGQHAAHVAQVQPLAGEVRRRAPRRADRPACAAPAAPARQAVAAPPPRRHAPAAPRPGCCSTGRTTGARPARCPRRDARRLAAASSGSRSLRNTNRGLDRMRCSPRWTPGVEACPAFAPRRRTPESAPVRRRRPADGRRGAASRARIRSAHARSVARDAGRHRKTSRRLGVSPGPVGSNGPVTAKVWMCGQPAQSKLSAEARRNGCSRTASFTPMWSMKAAVTTCGPAGTRTRARIRSSTASPVSVGLSNILSRSVGAADGDAVHGASVDGDLEVAGVLQPTHHVQVRAIELRVELILGVEGERVPHAQAADRCRAAGLPRVGSATDPAARGRCRFPAACRDRRPPGR